MDAFYSYSYEHEYNRRIVEDDNVEVPVNEIKEFMVSLINIPLTEIYSYLELQNVPRNTIVNEISQCGKLSSCTDDLCAILYEMEHKGASTVQIGRDTKFCNSLRVHNQSAWSRYGNKQVKTAQLLGLSFKVKRLWFLSCYGYVYVHQLTKIQQKKFLLRALLRNPFYAFFFLHVRMKEQNLSDYMPGLSLSTQSMRSRAVMKLLQIGLDEMKQSGIKYYDIKVPRYNLKKKALSYVVIDGIYDHLEKYDLKDNYFNGGIPLYTVQAACGYFVNGQIPELEGWLDLSQSGVKTNSKDFFVVQAKGSSMLPKIKNGDYCLFKWYRGESLYNDIVLTQCRDYDEEYESRYTIKCFHPKANGEGESRSIVLKPLNEEYNPIVLSEDDGCEYKVIGKFVKVLDTM